MVQPKQGLSLLKFIPKAMRPQTSDISSVALWGTTAACGALWLVQPFDWIKAQFSPSRGREQVICAVGASAAVMAMIS